jgi:hypothetical protein
MKQSLRSRNRSTQGRYRAPKGALTAGVVTRREWLRFLSKVRIGATCQCNKALGPHQHWHWGGQTDPAGYPNFAWRGCMYRAHRFAFVALGGVIPREQELDHLCRIRDCCNRACVEAVTHKVNMARGTAPASINLRKTHCLRGHPLSGDNLLIDSKGARACRICHGFRRRAEQARRRARQGRG